MGDSHACRMFDQSRFTRHCRSRYMTLASNLAVGGMTMDRYGRQLEVARSHRAEVVLLLIGGNDMDQPIVESPYDTAAKIFRAMLDLEDCGKLVYIVQCPTRFRTRNREVLTLQRHIRTLNATLRHKIGSRFIRLLQEHHRRAFFDDAGIHLRMGEYTRLMRKALYYIRVDIRRARCPPSNYRSRLIAYLQMGVY